MNPDTASLVTLNLFTFGDEQKFIQRVDLILTTDPDKYSDIGNSNKSVYKMNEDGTSDITNILWKLTSLNY